MDTIDAREKEIGGAIRRLRIQNGLSLEDVAHRAGLSPTSVRSLELGRGTTLSTMLKVLTVMGEAERIHTWFGPDREFSPIALLREKQRRPAYPQRVSRKRTANGLSTR